MKIRRIGTLTSASTVASALTKASKGSKARNFKIPTILKRLGGSVTSATASITTSAESVTSRTTKATNVTVIDRCEVEIPLILQVELQREDDPGAIAHGLKRLSEILEASHPKVALEQGAATIVVLTLKKYPTITKIQAYGCLCLRNLAYRCWDGKAAVDLAGGVDAVVRAMKTYQFGFRGYGDCAQMQVIALSALVNLLSGNPEGPPIVRAMTRKFVYKMDGLVFIYQSLKRSMYWTTRRPEQKTQIQRFSVAILDNISLGEEFQQHMFNNEKLVEMVETLRRKAKYQGDQFWLKFHSQRFLDRVYSMREC